MNISSSDITDNTVTPSTSNLRKLQYTTPSSRIPNCSTIKKTETSIKPLSVRTPTQIQSTLPSSSEITAKSKQPDGNIMTKSMNSNLPSLAFTKLSNKLKPPMNSTPVKKPSVQNEIVETCSTDLATKINQKNDKSTNIARVQPFKVEAEHTFSIPVSTTVPQQVITSNPSSDELDNEDFLKNNNEYNEELKLLNDITSEIEEDCMETNNNGYPSDKDLSTYARKIQKRFKEGMQAVKESMQFALSDEDYGSDAHFDIDHNRYN